ncbi:LacI family DNA-binding transcriptional regulator [Rhizobium mesoamericanum]|uniref:LacI family DNA-binding transcriptional regulator n=1 Tax=Rhizobium mesoamericanum TaxID=1079800 RepID=UPI00040EEA54|nr:LacI family DNA-binding transcriptional regulator [Rhizobium mesoamericanum]
MTKPTYVDIAKRAGVGSATVERVLNGRGGVKEHTAQKVLLAARALDWPGRMPEMHRGIIRIEVILVRPDTTFYARLAQAFRRIASSLDTTIQIHLTFLQEDDPVAISERITNPSIRRSGLVIASPSHPQIGAALRKAHKGGLPIVQVVSKTIEEADFVGIDNRAVGRMAGLMVSRFVGIEGTLVALCHSQIYQVHKERIQGFSDFIERNPREGLNFNHVFFGMDDHDASVRCVMEALHLWPDLVGFYNAGGANTAILQYLRRSGRKMFFAGHELTDVTRSSLADGTADVIFDQMPEAQARRATDLLFSKIGLLHETVDNPPIRFTTITAENL